MTCSSKEASATHKDLIQTKVIAPVVEDLRKQANDAIANYQKLVEASKQAPTNPQANALAKIKAMVANIDVAPILFEVQNIIMTDKTSYKVACKATIHWSGGGEWWQFPTNDDPFTFTVEKTVDGKLYVTESGLDQSLK